MSDPFGDKRDPLVKTMERNAVVQSREEIGRLRTALKKIIDISQRTPRRVLAEGEYPTPTASALTEVEEIAREALSS